jgi:hypothetical protein
MHWGERHAAYTAQTGSRRLTARQERRYVRKADRGGDYWPAMTHLDRFAQRDDESL